MLYIMIWQNLTFYETIKLDTELLLLYFVYLMNLNTGILITSFFVSIAIETNLVRRPGR